MRQSGIRSAVADVLVTFVLTVCMTITVPADGDQTTAVILDQAPNETSILLLIPSLSELNETFSTLNLTAGLNRPELDSLLSTFKRSTGLTTGVRDDGPMLITMSWPQEEGAQVTVLALVPVSDYQAMIEDLGGDSSVAVTQITLPTHHTAYARKMVDFAVIGPGQDSVQEYLPAKASADIMKKLGKVGNQCLDGAVLGVIVQGRDKARSIQIVQSVFMQGLMRAAKSVAAPPPGDPEAGTAVQQRPAPFPPGVQPDQGGQLQGGGSAITGLGGKMLTENLVKMNNASNEMVGNSRIVRDAEAIVFALGVSEDGLNLSAAVQFSEGSEMAEAFAGGGPTAAQLARLPDLPYMGAFALNFTGLDLNKVDPGLPKPVALGGRSDWLEKTILETHKKGKNVKGLTQVMYLPPAASVEGSPTSTIKVIETEDAEGFVQTLQKSLKAMNQAGSAGAAAAPDQLQQPSYSTDYNPNRLQLDGHRADQYVITRQALPVNPENLGALRQAAPMLTGIGSFDRETTGYVVAVDSFVVVTETTDTTLLRQVLKSLKQKKGLGTAGPLAATRKHLLADPTMEAYIDVSGILQSPIAMMISLMFGPPPVPPLDLMPVGMCLGSQERGVIAQLFVPASVMQFGVLVYESVTSGRRGGIPAPGRPNRRFRRPSMGPERFFTPGRRMPCRVRHAACTFSRVASALLTDHAGKNTRRRHPRHHSG